MSTRTVVNRLGWVIVTLVLVSAFWIFYYNIGLGGGGIEMRAVHAGAKPKRRYSAMARSLLTRTSSVNAAVVRVRA